MPLYTFTALNGDEIDRHYPMGEAPPFGTAIKHKGRMYERLPQVPEQRNQPDCRHVCYDLRDHPEAPHKDHMGRPVFHNRKEIREFAAKTGWTYDH